MTPIGAGVFPSALAGHLVDHDGSGCWKCEGLCTEHSGETLLGWFAERSLIIRDNHLVVVKNFLLFNRPDNPNQLFGYIASCEQLPRSKAFLVLRDHLRQAIPALPEWIFSGLLDPLADQQNKTLVSLYWERVGRSKEPSSKGSGKRFTKRSTEGIVEPSPQHRNKNSNSKQEQDIKEKQDNTSPRPEEEWPSVEMLVSLYNAATPSEFPAVKEISPARRKKAKQYLAAFPALEFWQEVFLNCDSRFLRGLSRNGTGHENFVADFDWLLSKGKDGTENCVKVKEGKYGDR